MRYPRLTQPFGSDRRRSVNRQTSSLRPARGWLVIGSLVTLFSCGGGESVSPGPSTGGAGAASGGTSGGAPTGGQANGGSAGSSGGGGVGAQGGAVTGGTAGTSTGGASGGSGGDAAGSGGSLGGAGAGGLGGGGTSGGGSSGGGASGGDSGSAGTSGGGSGGSGGSAGSGGDAGNAGTAGMPGDPGVPFAYVGGADGKITIYRFDRTERTLTLSTTVNAGSYPSFLTVDPTHRFLYAVLEASGQVAAFAIDRKTGGLTPLNQVDSGGGAPTHVAVDRSGRWVMVANYNGGSVRVFPIQDDGKLGSPSATTMPGTNPHLILTDRTNAIAYVPCKGSDRVVAYAFDDATGSLTPASGGNFSTAPGAGPRHLAFHPTLDTAYVINELDDTITALRYDQTGALMELQTLPTLPNGANGGGNTTAEVAVHPSGKFVYGSNRGHDSIVVYTVDAATGQLTLAGHDASGGRTPRHFSIEDGGAVMLVANRDTNNVVVFDIHPTTGRITKVSEVTNVMQPEYAAIVTVHGDD